VFRAYRFVLAGCTLVATAPQPVQPPAPKAALGAWGVELGGMDTSVKPGDDFFDYVNGNWLKTAVIRRTVPAPARSRDFRS